MAQEFSLRPVTAEAQVRSQVSLCEIYGGQSDSATGFSSGCPVFPCHYYSTNAPQSTSCTCCRYQKDKRVKPVSVSEIAEHWIANYIYFFLVLEGLIQCDKKRP
jgi:hypothetical protein